MRKNLKGDNMTQKELFYKLVEILKEYNIDYAITGRTEGYPDAIGSDVDIVVPRAQIDRFNTAVWRFDEIKGTEVIQMFQHECVAFYYIVYNISADGVFCIQPDVCTDYYRKGRLLLKSDYLLEGRHESVQGGFHVLASEKEFIYYLLKKIDKRSISEGQFRHIFACYKQAPSKAIDEASKFWDSRGVGIVKQAFEKEDLSLLVNNLEELQNGIHSSHKRGFTDGVRNACLKLRRIMNPTGLVIGVLGPDGSGKTTVMNQVKVDLVHAFRRINQYHLFPVPEKESSPNTDPHGKKKRGFIASFLKLCYFIALYNWGWAKLIMPAKIRSTFVIFDRYYDDILIDPARYRNGTPKWVVKFVRLFIPQPQLWIVLDAPTDVIQKRKAEVSYEETERQRQAYVSYAARKKNCLLVDTNREVSDISKDICQFICDSLHQRAIKRYKK